MVKNNLIIRLLQLDFIWEDRIANLRKIERIVLSDYPEKADLVLLPEMFSTGFTMNVSLAETMDGNTVLWMKKLAATSGSAIAGSMLISEGGFCYNRFVWCNPSGEIFTYDKRHLFRMGEENKYFTQGREVVTVPFLGWNIRLNVCYDLRFPVWSRNVDNSYDVLINVANWPGVRREAFVTLLKARAIENQCYAIGLNRVGTDGNKISYSGDSMVVDPKGKCLLGPLPEEECAESISLDYNDLVNFRNKFPAWQDADKFLLLD